MDAEDLVRKGSYGPPLEVKQVHTALTQNHNHNHNHNHDHKNNHNNNNNNDKKKSKTKKKKQQQPHKYKYQNKSKKTQLQQLRSCAREHHRPCEAGQFAGSEWFKKFKARQIVAKAQLQRLFWEQKWASRAPTSRSSSLFSATGLLMIS